MKEFTVAMSLVDFIPVLIFSAAYILLMRDLYNKMSKASYALFASGAVCITIAGFCKALYKLLYAAGVCDFDSLNQMMLPVQSIGYILLGIGIATMLLRRKGTKAAYAVAPPLFKGTFIFIPMMVVGLGTLSVCLSVLSVKLKKAGLIPLFILLFFCYMAMGYLSSKDFAQASMNWISEGVNILGSCLLLTGTLLLHKFGLEALRLEKAEAA